MKDDLNILRVDDDSLSVLSVKDTSIRSNNTYIDKPRVFIGHQVGYALTTGNSNVFIGERNRCTEEIERRPN